MNSKHFFSVVFLFLFVLCCSASVYGQTDIYIRGAERLYPIGVPQLCIEQGQEAIQSRRGGAVSAPKLSVDAATEIPEVIARNLDISGYFEVLNPAVYVEAPGKCDGPDGVAYTDWSVVRAEGLVRGIVVPVGDRIRVRLFLHDVPARKIVLGKEYEGDVGQLRRIAHRFSNEIMKYFTGEFGVFGSQISYTSNVGRFKELFVMEMDGSNVRQLTSDRGLAISSSWHPEGQSLIYTSYRNRIPDLFLIDINSRQIRQITEGDGLEIGGKFSRDGRSILSSLSVARDSDIVLLSPTGQLLRKITATSGVIDVSPHWSPDNSRIVFCSNRSGGPQIYTMNADGSGARRVSYVNSNYCTSPRWSPRGDRIAFVCRADGGFQVFTANPDGSAPLQLTSRGNNEDPDWSPDGRYLVFATTFGRGRNYNIAMIRSDGSSLRQLTSGQLSSTQPSWGPMRD
jgi:TolB protein